ncbi:MAG TPA: PQQ-binding-like beta-propeller repeat protein [Ktedonobacteraceae bacterium]|nr:PQQ-binding-like beta-propeller repeat protein [Ktedonobacteraceae bacterium]
MVDRIEQQSDNYHLVKLMDEEGFGKVHVGKHLHSDTEVAIKILDTQLISYEQEEEAPVIASLDHPSILRLLDCGLEEDKLSSTMNYAPDGTLWQEELAAVRKMTEPIVPAVLPVSPTPAHLPVRRWGARRNLRVALGLLLLALLVIGTWPFTSFFATRSAAPSPDTRSLTPAPTSLPTPKPTPVPTSITRPKPTPASTPVPTTVPTPKPTSASTPVPTLIPRPKPTPVPTTVPTPKPTPVPTLIPTPRPTPVPTPKPTPVPTTVPTPTPTPPPPSANSNGAMFGYDLQHTHYNPNETSINASNVSQLTLAWTASVSTYASPVYANGIVYVPGFNGSLYAFNATTGATLWVTSLSTSWINTTVAVAGGIVYVGCDDSNLYALNASTGAILWAKNANNSFVFSSPAVANGILYLGTDNGTFYAFNATTGAPLWTYTATSSNVASITAPAVVNGIVYFSSDNGSVYALDATTGVLKWSTPIPGLYLSAPAVANGILYIGANSLYALNATTGAIIWVSTANKGFSSSPAVVNGIVYDGSYDHTIYAFDAKTGAVIWTCRTGNVMIYPSPMVIPGVIFMGSDDNRFYALDASTGAKLWIFNLKSFVEVEPAVANGFVYLVGTRNATLYAFHLPAGSTGTHVLPLSKGGKGKDGPTSSQIAHLPRQRHRLP